MTKRLIFSRSLHGIIAAVALLTLFLSATLAQAQSPGGGFTGPGPGIITVEQAKNMRDDAKIALQGNIVQALGGDHYTFKDATGSVTVEIDHDKWLGQQIGPNDLVELHGEVDKDWTSFKIDVDRIVKK